MTILRRLLMVIPLLLPGGAAVAAGSGDSGTSFALNLTATTTIVIIAILFLILVLPEAERKKLGAAFASLRRYAVGGHSADAELPDHSYDGIRELDNRIPPWFTTLFAGTII